MFFVFGIRYDSLYAVIHFCGSTFTVTKRKVLGLRDAMFTSDVQEHGFDRLDSTLRLDPRHLPNGHTVK